MTASTPSPSLIDIDIVADIDTTSSTTTSAKRRGRG
jgi:hypothetical protein